MSKSGLAGVEIWAVGTTALAALGSLYFGSIDLTLGVMAGGAIMAGNLWVIRRVIEDVMSDEPDESKTGKRRTWVVLQYVLKLLAIFGILGALIKFGRVSPVGLMIGLTAALTALVVKGIRSAAFHDEE